MKAPRVRDKARDAGRELTDRWYRELESEEFGERNVVYTFTSGSIIELFRAFDFRVVLPEINAVHCSTANVAMEMIHDGEELGYAADVCSYVKSDLGLMAGPRKGNAPFGKIPAPDLIVVTHGGCPTHIKWAESLARELGGRMAIVDVPFVRDDQPTDFDHAYVRGQIESLIPVCEEMTGVSFDIDRLRRILGHTYEAIELFRKLLESGKLVPSPIDGFFEAVSYMAPLTIWRGTQEAVDYYRMAVAQMEERASRGYSPLGEERFRLLMDGSPPWARLGEFREMFARWSAVVVASSYARVVCSCEDLRWGPDDPIDFLAELAGQSWFNWNLARRRRLLEQLAREYKVDGIVAHSVRSCRPSSFGQLDLRNYFAQQAGIPALFLESDSADPRFFTTAEIMNRVNTFFEALSRRKEKEVGDLAIPE